MIDGAPSESYQYDANGNRTSVTSSGVSTTATYDAQDKLLQFGGASYGYNANGDVVSKTDGVGTTSYVYDGFGTLKHVSLPDGRAIDYALDARGRRVAKAINGTRVAAWIYENALKPVAELDASGNIVSRYVYGRSRLVPDYMVRGASTYRFITDQNLSVRMLVDTATGNVAQAIDYDAWGNVLRDTNPGFQPFGFASGIYDSDTRLVLFGARELDTSSGRWLTRDAAGLRGGLNLYEYCGDDPANWVDPRGRAAVPVPAPAPTPLPLEPVPFFAPAANDVVVAGEVANDVGAAGLTLAPAGVATGGFAVGVFAGPILNSVEDAWDATNATSLDESAEEGGAQDPCNRNLPISDRQLGKKFGEHKDPDRPGWGTR